MKIRKPARILASSLILLAGASSLALPVEASATTAGENGRISFMRRDSGDHWQIWTANPDLTAQHRITDGDYDNGWAAWSPDGSRLAFDSARSAPAAGGDLKEIFTMRPDGSDVRQVTHLGFYAGQPTWSADGQWIAFTTDGGDYPTTQGIYVIHPDGTGLRRVVGLPSGPNSVWLDAPRFSPDGKQIAYTYFQGGKETPAPWSWKGEKSSLWVVNLDGSAPHQVVAPGMKVGDADWSPDGRYLVYEQMGNDPGKITSVLRVPAGGGGVTALTHDTGYRGGRSDAWSFEASFDPVYSPDGTAILYPHDDYSPTFGCTSLQIMHADGSDQHWVNDECGVEHQVDWGTASLE
jgi:TolB protein